MGALPVHHTPTVDTPWDKSAVKADDETGFRYCYAWVDGSADASLKGSYSFPHHLDEGGPANVSACRNALARVGNSSIPAADKPGVRRHVQAHLDDANKKSGNSARLLAPAGMQAMMRRIHALAPTDGRKWYRFTNAADDESTLYIFGPIGGWFGANAEDFVEDLAQVSGPLNVHINSGGGDAFEGITIANLLRNHPSTVNGVVAGMAASAASIIAMACDSLTMSPGSQLMIHRAMKGVYGNRDDMAEAIDMLDRMDTSLAGLYQLRAGGEMADWAAAMQAETWYTPQEAVDAGLADHIAEPPDKAGEEQPAWGNDVGREGVPAPVLPVAVSPPAAPAATEPEPEPEPVVEPEPAVTQIDPEKVSAALRAAFATPEGGAA